MAFESLHLSTFIAADPAAVYDFAADPANLPAWAAGLAAGIRQDGGRWVADAPFGEVEVRMAPPNEFGVLDHDVVMPDGTIVSNPLRVIPAEGGAEVVFTLRRRAGMSDEEYDADRRAVEADLASLRQILAATRL